MTTAMTTYEEQIKAIAAAQENATGSATEGRKVSLKDKVFTFPDGHTDTGPIKAVIVDFVPRHMYYDEIYREDDPKPPVCFAIGGNARNMIPSDNSSDKQNDDCNSCPMFEFGSNPNGRGGKACKETRLLAIVAPDAGPEDPIYFIEPSVTAVKGFDAYINSVQATVKEPSLAVVTTIWFDETKTYPVLKFGKAEPNPNKHQHAARFEEAHRLLTEEPKYEEIAFEEPAPKPRGRGRSTATKKAPARRK